MIDDIFAECVKRPCFALSEAVLELVFKHAVFFKMADAMKHAEEVGMPKSMAEIGIDESILPMTFKAAKDIRDKYVLPRLCFDLGVIDDIIFN